MPRLQEVGVKTYNREALSMLAENAIFSWHATQGSTDLPLDGRDGGAGHAAVPVYSQPSWLRCGSAGEHWMPPCTGGGAFIRASCGGPSLVTWLGRPTEHTVTWLAGGVLTAGSSRMSSRFCEAWTPRSTTEEAGVVAGYRPATVHSMHGTVYWQAMITYFIWRS